MIEPDKRKAIFLLHQEGMSVREISRRMIVSKKTVTAIIQQKGAVPDSIRKDKIAIDYDLMSRLYSECEGRIQRVHEKLLEEEGLEVGYSTLTRMIRELEIGQPRKQRCDRVPDEPGAEIQHDTSPYEIGIGEKKLRIVGSLLYFRYSKQRYLKFYRAFNRFRMKCFFHEALTFFGYTAGDCIIDNTSLARLRGTGKNAVMTPEMEGFASQYGFKFVCHERGHHNRKAGNERNFFTVETNFFPGRKFESMEDLNSRAFEWATKRMALRPVGKPGLIPAEAFEYEKPFLAKLPPYVEPPYLVHGRCTDQYGYASFRANFYWVPGTRRDDVTILEYSDSIKIFRKRKQLAEYRLPPEGVKNKRLSPEGLPKPKYRPHNRKRPTEQEEKRLRAISEEVDGYLNLVLREMGIKKHRFLRELFSLSQKIAAPLFVKTIKRALKYRITDTKTIERIAVLQMSDGLYEMPLVEVDEEFRLRDTYIEGRLSDEPDLSIYKRMLEEEDDE